MVRRQRVFGTQARASSVSVLPQLLLALLFVSLCGSAWAQETLEEPVIALQMPEFPTQATLATEAIVVGPPTLELTASEASLLPKAILLVDPNLATPWGHHQVAFRTLAKTLDDYHVPLVNRWFKSPIHWDAYTMAKHSTSRDAASKIALQHRAEVAVTLNAKAIDAGFGGDLLEPYLSKATVSGYVIVAATGRPVGGKIVVHESAGGPEDKVAQENAVKLAAEFYSYEVMKKLLDWSRRRAERGDPYLIRIWGVRDYVQVMRMRSVIGSLPRFADVTQKGVSVSDPTMENFAEVSLVYSGTPERLRSTVISSLATEVAPLVLRVRSATSQLIELQLTEPEPDSPSE